MTILKKHNNALTSGLIKHVGKKLSDTHIGYFSIGLEYYSIFYLQKMKDMYNISLITPPQKERTSFFPKEDNLFRESFLGSANHYELSLEKML